MSLLQEIAEWSKTRPLWQRDALRRIVTNGGAIQRRLRSINNYSVNNKEVLRLGISIITPIPLSENDIPNQKNPSTTIKLKSLHDLIGVITLTSDSNLSFGLSGLTIIYGIMQRANRVM